MQDYFGPFYFGELKPYNFKYCSNFVLQLIFAPFNFAVLFGSQNSRNKGHANIKGFTVFIKVQYLNTGPRVFLFVDIDMLCCNML